MLTWLLTTTGFLLNVVGLGMASVALWSENRARGLGDLPGTSFVRSVRRFAGRLIGRRPHTTINAGVATGTHGFASAWADGYVTSPIDPDAPAHEQVATLERNMNSLIESQARAQAHRDELKQKAIAKLEGRFEGVNQGLLERDLRDARISRRSIHTELVGVTIALFGTLLGSSPALFQAWPS